MNSTSDKAASIKEYKNLLLSVRNLPPMPLIMIEVSKKLDNPRTSASQLSELIMKDQGLVSKILAVANSPFYGLLKRVSTIEMAIVILGFEQLKNIILALSVIDVFKPVADTNWDKKAFWKHSLTVASFSKRIANDLSYPKPSEAFLAGLLHDFGLTVLHKYFYKQFLQILKTASTKNIFLKDAEYQVMGINHCDIAAFLVEKWDFPNILGEPIIYHHHPSLSKEYPVISSIVHLADFITQELKAGDFIWDSGIKLDESIIERLKLGDKIYLYNYINNFNKVTVNEELFQGIF